MRKYAYSETQYIGNPGQKKNVTIALGKEWGAFCYPLQGNKISDYGIRSGRMHSGVDLKAQPLDTIRSVGDGIVRMAKEYYGYGNMVLVSHPNGLETLYGHNTRNLVEPNQVVRAGEPIALAGRTGRATTEHLHFEVRHCGEYFDPSLLLDYEARSIRKESIYLSYNKEGKLTASNKKGGSATGVSDSGPTDTSSYTVKQGDTLYSISRRHGLTVDRICELNGISPSDPIKPGQTLKVR